MPKDPGNSWDNAKKNSLRVGMVLLKDSDNEKLLNTEKKIVEGFANTNHLEVSYQEGSESGLTKMLEEHKLDILIGGFEKKSNWKTVVGMTKPYDSTHVIFIPKGENELLYHLEEYILSH